MTGAFGWVAIQAHARLPSASTFPDVCESRAGQPEAAPRSRSPRPAATKATSPTDNRLCVPQDPTPTEPCQVTEMDQVARLLIGTTLTCRCRRSGG
jgi:hypothetical protein